MKINDRQILVNTFLFLAKEVTSVLIVTATSYACISASNLLIMTMRYSLWIMVIRYPERFVPKTLRTEPGRFVSRGLMVWWFRTQCVVSHPKAGRSLRTQRNLSNTVIDFVDNLHFFFFFVCFLNPLRAGHLIPKHSFIYWSLLRGYILIFYYSLNPVNRSLGILAV